MEAKGKAAKWGADADPPLQRPPKPLGSGGSSLGRDERNAVIGVALIVVLYAAVCLWLGWDGPAGTVELVFIDGFAGLFSMLYLATVWLGVSEKPPIGFQVGSHTYLGLQQTVVPAGTAARVASLISQWIPWQLREPLFRLPVLLPIAWAAAAFAGVQHQVRGDIHGQLEPTLIALLAGMIAINGFLAVRGQHTVDFIGALAGVLALIAGTVISLVQIAGGGKGQVHWVAAALVFGLVAILQTGIRGADSPDDGEPASTQPPYDRTPEGALPSAHGSEPPPPGPCPKPPHCPPSRQREVNPLAPAGGLAALVVLVLFLWLVVRRVSWGSTRESQVLHSALLLCAFAWLGFVIAALRTKDPKWFLPALISALLTTAFGFGGSWVEKHLPPTTADCLAFDAQFGELVGDQTEATALRLSKYDQRRAVCWPPLEKLTWRAAEPDCLAFDAQFGELVRNESLAVALRAMEADGRRAVCRSTLGRIKEFPPVTDCVTFLAQLDALVDDEPIKVAAVAIERDPRTRVCHPRLGVLARG
jgi:hypothetical protein